MIRPLAVTVSMALATTVAADPGLQPFTSYYAFGDSLSQDDKLPQLTPPSLEGRFSSGRVWAEYLADVFTAAGKDTANYALGGATAGSVNGTSFEGFFPNPRNPQQDAELGQLQALSTFGGQIGIARASAPETGDNPLVSVLFGANDVFQQLPQVTADVFGRSAPEALIDNLRHAVKDLSTDVAADVVTGITELNAGNAQFDDFLVVNLPDLSQTPGFGPWGIGAAQAQLAALRAQLPTNGDQARPGLLRDIAQAESQLTFLTFDLSPGPDTGPGSLAQFASQEFNAALEQALTSLDSDISTTLFRQDLFLTEFLATSLADGKEIFQPCTPSFSQDTGQSCAYILDDTGRIIGLDGAAADGFFFGDSVHPNGFVHEEFGRRVIAALDGTLPAPVPLPAGLPLLLAGLCALGVMARRKGRAV